MGRIYLYLQKYSAVAPKVCFLLQKPVNSQDLKRKEEKKAISKRGGRRRCWYQVFKFNYLTVGEWKHCWRRGKWVGNELLWITWALGINQLGFLEWCDAYFWQADLSVHFWLSWKWPVNSTIEIILQNTICPKKSYYPSLCCFLCYEGVYMLWRCVCVFWRHPTFACFWSSPEANILTRHKTISK